MVVVQQLPLLCVRCFSRFVLSKLILFRIFGKTFQMIQTENIAQEHSIEGVLPNYFIELPLSEKENVDYKDVTCLFIIQEGLYNRRCIAIEHFDSFNNSDFFNDRYNGYTISFIYVFKGLPFDIIKLKQNGWFKP